MSSQASNVTVVAADADSVKTTFVAVPAVDNVVEAIGPPAAAMTYLPLEGAIVAVSPTVPPVTR